MSKKAKANKPEGKKTFWKKLTQNRGLTAMIAALAVALVVGIVVLISMKTDGKVVAPRGPHIQISSDFYHVAPEGLDLNNAISVKNETTAKDYLRQHGGYSADMEPKPYDKGWYIFDDNGIARQYRDENGKIHDLPKEEQVEHIDVVMNGAPLQIIGDVKMHFVVYKSGENVARCFQYFILTDKTDMEFLQAALNRCGISNVKQVSNLVVEVDLDTKQIMDTMGHSNEPGLIVDVNMSLTNYLKNLEEQYGVKVQ